MGNNQIGVLVGTSERRGLEAHLSGLDQNMFLNFLLKETSALFKVTLISVEENEF